MGIERLAGRRGGSCVVNGNGSSSSSSSSSWSRRQVFGDAAAPGLGAAKDKLPARPASKQRGRDKAK